MSNKTAALKYNLTYVDNDGQTIRSPASGQETISAAYQAENQATIDVPDTTAADTEYAVGFGAVDAAATYLEIENKLGADLKVRVNEPPTASGTLASGTVDLTLANVAGDELSVERTTSAGTAGVLSVKRKSDTEVTVQSWLAGTGLQELDTSTVKVRNRKDGYPFQIPANGTMVVAGAAAPAAGRITAAKVKTTATQSGAGTVATRVFGDPT